MFGPKREDPPLSLPLLTAEQGRGAVRLRNHVTVLAGDIGERNLWNYRALCRSRDYIAEYLREQAYRVRLQEFLVDGTTVANVEAELTGRDKPGEIIIVGAHYDSVRGSPGANDNASGVAALLELAETLAGTPLRRTVRFVAFVNEEPPFFKTGLMGSFVYAEEAARKQERIVAMLSLETIGYYDTAPGSQRYPFPLGLLYPDRGDYIGFVSNVASRPLLSDLLVSFRRHSRFPVEGVAAPGLVPGIDWSDQWAFWKRGWPGVMVTDTALYRYPHYHSALDTPDKIDSQCLARVVEGLTGVLRDLAETSR